MKFENLLYNDLHWKNLSDWAARIVRHERVDNSNLERVTLSIMTRSFSVETAFLVPYKVV